MDNMINVLRNGKITVKLDNENQEKEFRKLCKKHCNNMMKQGDVILSRKDDTAFNDMNTEKEPIYPVYYTFMFYGNKTYIGWSLYTPTLKETLIISFKDFKNNFKGKRK